MEFMVENQLAHGVQGLTNKITRHREWIANLCETSWDACTTSLDDHPYRSDVIIANPPSFVGYHIAQKLSIPLIMSFTMPWTATSEFPSPFVRTKSGPKKNYLSYMALDRVIWTGIRDIINKWREEKLHLPPVRTKDFSGHRLLYDLKIPYIYCFSEHLLPKPKDWGDWIGVSGFFSLETKNNYEPPEELENFLNNGEEPPVFIGFGSIVVADPDALTKCVLEAVKLAGCRAIIQQGWAGMKIADVPDNILPIGPAPHDWLFERCSAVVHHGGAGTTCTGLTVGKPTIVVPFFGDQFFWGETIARMELGPKPIIHPPITEKTYLEIAKNLAEGIKFALQENIIENAKQCGVQLREEKGVDNGVFYLKKFLPVDRMKCDICPRNVPEIHCISCNLNYCTTCNAVVHSKIEGFEEHTQTNYRIVNWKKHANWWGAYYNAIADGGTAFRTNVGTGVVSAVNAVSDGQGVTGKVTGVGKGLISVASGVLSGTSKAFSTTYRVAKTPPYQSPTKSPLVLKRSAKDSFDEDDLTLSVTLVRDIIDSYTSKVNGDESGASIPVTINWDQYSDSDMLKSGDYPVPDYRETKNEPMEDSASDDVL